MAYPPLCFLLDHKAVPDAGLHWWVCSQGAAQSRAAHSAALPPRCSAKHAEMQGAACVADGLHRRYQCSVERSVGATPGYAQSIVSL